MTDDRRLEYFKAIDDGINIIFYIAVAIVISATGLAITRQSAVHAVLSGDFLYGNRRAVLYSWRPASSGA